MKSRRPTIRQIATCLAAFAVACTQLDRTASDPVPTETPPPPPTNQPSPMEPPVGEPPPSFTVGTHPIGEAKSCEVDLLSPAPVYGNKIKTILTGLPLTPEELTLLSSQPDELQGMIDTWFATPEASNILRRFFKTAFQQDQIDPDGITMMIARNNLNWGRFGRQSVAELLLDNMQQSFARTALRIVREGRPFNDVVTTESFEMTTALLAFYALLDQRHVDEQGRVFARPMDEVTDFVALRNRADEPPIEEQLDPNSPNFMRIWIPNFNDLCLPDNATEFTFQENAFNRRDKIFWVFSTLVGRPDRFFNREANAGRPGNPCRAGTVRRTPLLREADFSDWRTVRFRDPGLQETPTRFYNLNVLRQATDLASYADRVGFFTTMGFFGTWPTNEDNAARVTLNQTLITALGASFDGTTVSDFSPPNLNSEHSAPGSSCYGCHQTLDPMRDFIRHSYSPSYGEQHDENRMNLEAHFVFRGVRETGSGVEDLATIIAGHPDFARAWVQKLCFFANAEACPEESEEFTAVVNRFEESNLDFAVLVRELFSSSLVTNAGCMAEPGTGHNRSISRRDQFCAQLSNRLGIQDICGLDTLPLARSTLQRNMATAVASVPVDTFGRGEPDPINIAETGLFTRATREVVCTTVAERAFGAVFGEMGRDEALRAMVSRVMGLPENDPRHPGAFWILEDHVVDGVALGETERVALQSALVLACMSPGIAGVGF